MTPPRDAPLVSVLLPSTGRSERLRTCLTGLVATTAPHPLEIVCVIDADYDSVEAALTRPTRDGITVRVHHNPAYGGCSAAWNQALARSTGDYLVFAADDLVWGSGWLDEALRVMWTAFDPKGGLVGFNDGHWNGNELATHYLMSRWFVLNVLGGRVAWEGYRHSFNDVEVNARAKRAGRFAWAERAHVRHEHWTFGDRPQDATDTRTLGAWGESAALFERRRAAGFPDDAPPVIAA